MTREFNTSPIQSFLRSTISQEDAGSHAVDCEKLKVGGETTKAGLLTKPSRRKSETMTVNKEKMAEEPQDHQHRQKTQGPEEMCLSLEHQNRSKTSEKMGYFDRVAVSLHIL